jgi:hypothetical protein
MYIRFVIPSRHEDSHRLTGIFYAAGQLLDSGRLSEDEHEWCDEILDWFNCRLPFPDRFSRSRRRHACGEAVCWFRDNAARYIQKVRELAAMLNRRGNSVEMLWTGRPGYIVYEDSYQVVAVPFRETRA